MRRRFVLLLALLGLRCVAACSCQSETSEARLSAGAEAHNVGAAGSARAAIGGTRDGMTGSTRDSNGDRCGAATRMLTAGPAGQSGAGTIGPRFIGRFDRTNTAAPVFAWSGSAIALRFNGSAISVTLTDGGENFFEVVLDGQLSVLQTQQGSLKYLLGSGLANGPHDLLLSRRTEAFFGETTFGGFDLDPSAYLQGDPQPTRRLEVIGDSISAGYGNEGTLPCEFTGATENHYLTYEALAARSLQAELYTEAWSGIGMSRNYDGTMTGTMPMRYALALPQRSVSRWDFSQFSPDAVVINLGSNDFAGGDPGSAFQDTYTQFVMDLRGHYPTARLFLAVGPMLSDAQYQQAARYLKGVIATRAAAGDDHLTLLEFGTQDGATDGFGCDYHPSLKTHQKMSDTLVAVLKAELGW